MIQKILDFHIIVVSLFLILFISKAILLLVNKNKLLQKSSQRTKRIETVLGIMAVVSGVYILTISRSVPNYLIVNIALAIITIPLAILSLKRKSKVFTLVAILSFTYIYAKTINKNLSFTQQQSNKLVFNIDDIVSSNAENIIDANNKASIQQGKVIYKVLCVECHGEDGNSSSLQNTDLTKSHLSLEERVEIIMYGKGNMQGYNAELSEQEITLVAAFTETLK